MIVFLKKKLLYTIAYAIFLTAGLSLLSQIAKGDLILFFAEHRTDFLNHLFSFFTILGEGVGYFIIFAIALFIRFRYSILMLVTAASVALVANIFKNIFQHPRPKPYFGQLGQDISEIAVAGHRLLESQVSSFPSGHTISGFALFTVLALLSSQKWLQMLCLLTAMMIGISRVYLVYHFLEDVLVGSFLGVFIAYFLAYGHSTLSFDQDKWYNQALLKRKK